MLSHKSALRIASQLCSDTVPNLKDFVKGRFDYEIVKQEIDKLVTWADRRVNRVSTPLKRDIQHLQYYFERKEGMKYIRWENITYARWAEFIPKG